MEMIWENLLLSFGACIIGLLPRKTEIQEGDLGLESQKLKAMKRDIAIMMDIFGILYFIAFGFRFIIKS